MPVQEMSGGSAPKSCTRDLSMLTSMADARQKHWSQRQVCHTDLEESLLLSRSLA